MHSQASRTAGAGGRGEVGSTDKGQCGVEIGRLTRGKQEAECDHFFPLFPRLSAPPVILDVVPLSLRRVCVCPQKQRFSHIGACNRGVFSARTESEDETR